MSTDIKKMVHDTANKLNDIYHGYYFWLDDEMVTDDKIPAEYFDDDGFFRDGYELETVGLYDYFEDCLSVEYIASTSGNKGVNILIAWGGPSLWVDTYSGVVGGAWWSPTYTESLPNYICDEIDMLFDVDMYELEHI